MLFDLPNCAGCRTCEMACAFHHTEEFEPTVSSIKIVDKDGQNGFIICLFEQGDGHAIPCDRCEDLESPLCVQYCSESLGLGEILKKFQKKGYGAEAILTDRGS